MIRWQVRIGDDNLTGSVPIHGKVFDIVQAKIHPNYNKEVAYYDIGIITTNYIEFVPGIKPICLHSDSYDGADELDFYSNHAMELIGMISL